MKRLPKQTELTPSGVLLALRDNEDNTFEGLCRLLDIPVASTTNRGFRRRQKLSDILDSLLTSGIVETTGTNQIRPTPQWFAFQKCLQFSLHDLAERSSAMESSTWDEISNLIDRSKDAPICEDYADDFLKTLDEIRMTFASGCLVAVISLCGKVLEICLKEILRTHEVPYDESWGIGRLIKAVREAVPAQYLDPSLGSIVNVINNARIPAIHSKKSIPVPSHNQAVMVIHATADVADRFLASLKEE